MKVFLRVATIAGHLACGIGAALAADTIHVPKGASLQAALSKANSGDTVLVARGEFDGPVALKPGVTVRGGYDDTFKNAAEISDQDLESTERQTEKYKGYTVLTNVKDDRVVALKGGEATLKNVVVVGSSPAGWGRSTYAVVLEGGAVLHMDTVKVIAGNGTAGQAESTGKRGEGYCAKGGGGGAASELTVDTPGCHVIGGELICPGGKVQQVCKSEGGGTGTSVEQAIGGRAGGAGSTECTSGNASQDHGGPGENGGDGQHGYPGSAGKRNPDALGLFALDNGRLGWTNQPGGPGGNGKPGAGGGGGGAGGSRWVVWLGVWCGKHALLGGSGGRGGDGGCPGGGGAGGHPGGGSFGIVMNDARLVADAVAILKGTGGKGGDGANGGEGVKGESGDHLHGTKTTQSSECWPDERHSGPGGDGGPGGNGGYGGGGAGGNGGPSIGIAKLGRAEISGDILIRGGRSGKGGDGGLSDRVRHGESGHEGPNPGEQAFNLKP